MRGIAGLIVLGAGLVWAGGCSPEDYPDLAPATLAEIDDIREDDDLSPQEKRSRLEALGLQPLTVNALLRDERLANQFGGDLRTAYTKVTTPDLLALTPDEVQIYGDEASQVDDELEVELTDEEAQAIVDFFDEHDLRSPDQLQAYLDDPANVVPDEIPSGVLRSLFVDFDPNLLLPRLP